jgi:hypothetical protein
MTIERERNSKQEEHDVKVTQILFFLSIHKPDLFLKGSRRIKESEAIETLNSLPDTILNGLIYGGGNLKGDLSHAELIIDFLEKVVRDDYWVFTDNVNNTVAVSCSPACKEPPSATVVAYVLSHHETPWNYQQKNNVWIITAPLDENDSLAKVSG